MYNVVICCVSSWIYSQVFYSNDKVVQQTSTKANLYSKQALVHAIKFIFNGIVLQKEQQLTTNASYVLFHINLIQANRNIFITSARITAESQFNIVTGGSG